MKENTISHVEEEERFRRLDTEKKAEKRTLKMADDLFRRFWNQWGTIPPKPRDTYTSLKHGRIPVEKSDTGDFVGGDYEDQK